jgi:uncharacterized protein YydD (DUF2326 family)
LSRHNAAFTNEGGIVIESNDQDEGTVDVSCQLFDNNLFTGCKRLLIRPLGFFDFHLHSNGYLATDIEISC